ncbi:MAG: hypothetical protein J3R72DRAFT_240309 [Linnemannia gamsii]|nr:MAG: hypothetical protein J3R72DRAFT_240309 [Linnemannia gamsii]
MGSPLTLNIRNLLWHGFIIPDDEIPLDAYGAMLIVTTMSIVYGLRHSPLLKDGLQFRHGVPKSSYYFDQRTRSGSRDNLVQLTTMTKAAELERFDAEYERLAYGCGGRLPLLLPELDQGDDGGKDRLWLTLEAIVRKSSFVTVGTVEQWISALRHLEATQSTGSTGTTTSLATITTIEGAGTAAEALTTSVPKSSFMFVMASLPLLEHGLRLMYVRLNGCKNDRTCALVAGEYYLTLDVILDPFVPPEYYEPDAAALKEYRVDLIPNRLYSELGHCAMVSRHGKHHAK